MTLPLDKLNIQDGEPILSPDGETITVFPGKPNQYEVKSSIVWKQMYSLYATRARHPSMKQKDEVKPKEKIDYLSITRQIVGGK